MPFSHLTRWLRDGRTAPRRARTSLRVESMEDRRTPAASLISTNFSLTAAANDDSQLVAVASRGRYAIFTSTATDVVAGQIDSAGTSDLFWVDTLTGQRKLVTATAGSNGTIATGQVGQAVISADGLSVGFVSNVNVATYDTNYVPSSDAGSITDDVFRWDSATGTIRLASREAANRAIGQSTGSSNPRQFWAWRRFRSSMRWAVSSARTLWRTGIIRPGTIVRWMGLPCGGRILSRNMPFRKRSRSQ